jgi:3D (Asp-Asp-Asp) domain-containing protein
MKSTSLGSAVSVLLAFSAISHAKTYVQNPKPVQPAQQVQTLDQRPESQPANAEATVSGSTVVDPAIRPLRIEKAAPSTNDDDFEVAPQAYTATAYSLRGRTASGRTVSRGLIAADLSVLPLGTRVRLEAGSLSGEYVVADTGGAVKGRRIDIWTPTAREALQFGRRVVKLTVLSFGGRRAKSASVRPRLVNPSPASSPATLQEKQER